MKTPEQFQPAPEEMKKAEKIMTEEQKKRSREREATLEVGRERGTEERILNLLDKKEQKLKKELIRAFVNLDKIKELHLYSQMKPEETSTEMLKSFLLNIPTSISKGDGSLIEFKRNDTRLGTQILIEYEFYKDGELTVGSTFINL